MAGGIFRGRTRHESAALSAASRLLAGIHAMAGRQFGSALPLIGVIGIAAA